MPQNPLNGNTGKRPSLMDRFLDNLDPAASEIISCSMITSSFNGDERFDWTPSTGIRVSIPDRHGFVPFERASAADLRNRLFPFPSVRGRSHKNAPPSTHPAEKGLAWWYAQLVHYGLPITCNREDAQKSFKRVIDEGKLVVPLRLRELETKLKRQYVINPVVRPGLVLPEQSAHDRDSTPEPPHLLTLQGSRTTKTAVNPGRIERDVFKGKEEKAQIEARSQERKIDDDEEEDDDETDSLVFHTPMQFSKKSDNNVDDEGGSVIFSGSRKKRSKVKAKKDEKDKTNDKNRSRDKDHAEQKAAGQSVTDGTKNNKQTPQVIDISSDQDEVTRKSRKKEKKKKSKKKLHKHKTASLDHVRQTTSKELVEVGDHTGPGATEMSGGLHPVDRAVAGASVSSQRRSRVHSPVELRSTEPNSASASRKLSDSPTTSDADGSGSDSDLPSMRGLFSSQKTPDKWKLKAKDSIADKKRWMEIEKSYDPKSVPALREPLSTIPAYLKTYVRHDSPELSQGLRMASVDPTLDTTTRGNAISGSRSVSTRPVSRKRARPSLVEIEADNSGSPSTKRQRQTSSQRASAAPGVGHTNLLISTPTTKPKKPEKVALSRSEPTKQRSENAPSRNKRGSSTHR